MRQATKPALASFLKAIILSTIARAKANRVPETFEKCRVQRRLQAVPHRYALTLRLLPEVP
jgi:hypothetical protein